MYVCAVLWCRTEGLHALLVEPNWLWSRLAVDHAFAVRWVTSCSSPSTPFTFLCLSTSSISRMLTSKATPIFCEIYGLLSCSAWVTAQPLAQIIDRPQTKHSFAGSHASVWGRALTLLTLHAENGLCAKAHHVPDMTFYCDPELILLPLFLCTLLWSFIPPSLSIQWLLVYPLPPTPSRTPIPPSLPPSLPHSPHFSDPSTCHRLSDGVSLTEAFAAGCRLYRFIAQDLSLRFRHIVHSQLRPGANSPPFQAATWCCCLWYYWQFELEVPVKQPKKNS